MTIFWCKKGETFWIGQKLGFTVYVNYNGFDYEQMIAGCFPLKTTIMELAEIAPYFAHIIAFRSGACDLIAQTDANLSIIHLKEIDEPRVKLERNDSFSARIYDLIDRSGIFCYQYTPNLSETLIQALLEHVRTKEI